jgi:hypothetical protein
MRVRPGLMPLIDGYVSYDPKKIGRAAHKARSLPMR